LKADVAPHADTKLRSSKHLNNLIGLGHWLFKVELRLQFGAPYWEFDLWTPHRGYVCLWCLFALEPSLVSAIMASTASALRSPGERTGAKASTTACHVLVLAVISAPPKSTWIPPSPPLPSSGASGSLDTVEKLDLDGPAASLAISGQVKVASHQNCVSALRAGRYREAPRSHLTSMQGPCPELDRNRCRPWPARGRADPHRRPLDMCQTARSAAVRPSVSPAASRCGRS
jgi:hypothetical protein